MFCNKIKIHALKKFCVQFSLMNLEFHFLSDVTVLYYVTCSDKNVMKYIVLFIVLSKFNKSMSRIWIVIISIYENLCNIERL